MLNSWFFDPEFERVEGNYDPEEKFTRFHCQNLAGLKERVKISRYQKNIGTPNIDNCYTGEVFESKKYPEIEK